jgi:sugar O-acyltransferase (sialic acid O-acetyltransferase NeuD family)
MNKKPLIIIGNGGHASVLKEILLAQGYKFIGYTAPQQGENKFGLNYIGTDEVIEQYHPNEIELVLGVGMITPNSLKQKLFTSFKAYGYTFSSVIHPAAIVAPSVKLREGVQVMAGAILQTNTVIADNTIVNTGVIIDHDCIIGAHTHLAPGTKISGNVRVGASTHIGTGTTIIQGIEIGSNCLIGAGSVVVKNIKDNTKAFGVPAKEVTNGGELEKNNR